MKQIMTPDGQEGPDEQLEYRSIEEAPEKSDEQLQADRMRRSAAEIEREYSYGDVPSARTASDEIDAGQVHPGSAENPRRLDH